MSKRTVLVVDDEPVLVDQICESLEAAGFQTLSAESGKKALELFSTNAVDVILSDIRMVQGDGIWLMQQVRALGKPLKCFIVMTAFSDHTRAELLVKGADEVFQKPFKTDHLTQYIRGVLS